MKKLSQLALLLALVLGYSSQSQASLLIEPVIGYSFGKNNIDLEVPSDPSQNDNSSDSLKGTSFGGRLGYQNLGLQIGVDYLNSNLKVDGDAFKTSEWAGFIGYEFPVLFRVYAGYIFSGTGESEDIEFEGATGPKLGVGLTLLPFLDFNVEYRQVTYDEYDDIPGAKINDDYSAIMVGFSLPITL